MCNIDTQQYTRISDPYPPNVGTLRDMMLDILHVNTSYTPLFLCSNSTYLLLQFLFKNPYVCYILKIIFNYFLFLGIIQHFILF